MKSMTAPSRPPRSGRAARRVSGGPHAHPDRAAGRGRARASGQDVVAGPGRLGRSVGDPGPHRHQRVRKRPARSSPSSPARGPAGGAAPRGSCCTRKRAIRHRAARRGAGRRRSPSSRSRSGPRRAAARRERPAGRVEAGRPAAARRAAARGAPPSPRRSAPTARRRQAEQRRSRAPRIRGRRRRSPGRARARRAPAASWRAGHGTAQRDQRHGGDQVDVAAPLDHAPASAVGPSSAGSANRK